MTEADTDILSIDNNIQLSFENESKKLPQYKTRLEELEKTYNSSNISSRTKIELEKNISELRENIEKLENKQDLNFYIIETAELIQKYKDILKTPVKLSFCGKPKQDDKEKNDIVKKYIEIAQKYYKIDVKPDEKKFKIVCEWCGNKREFAVEENAYICVDCGCQQEILQHTTSYKDSDRVNISAKYTYDRKVHFRDCINQYQGKQNCTIGQEVYDSLEDAFERHHLLVGDKSEKKEVRFGKITKDHVLMFLKELGFSKQYENVTLIHYNMTGKKPDDISYLEDKLMSDFDLLIETYDKHFKKNVSRVNFISTHYVLYQLLMKHKHPCKKEDFVMLKTTERKQFHNDVLEHLFSNLSWSYYSVV
jgi:hypothetical protein